MAIRDVGAKPTVGAGAAGGVPPTLERGLNEAGLTAGGRSAGDAAQTLLSNLGRAGFSAPPKGDVTTQLTAALKAFQAQKGLAQSGQLDQATQGALKNAGVFENPQAQQKAGERDGFERGASLLKQGEKQRADVVSQSTPDTNFLDALLNQLGPGGPNEGMSSADVKGAAQANEAQAHNIEKKDKVAEAKKAEGAQKKGTTTDSQRELEAATSQQLDKGNAAGVKVARGLQTDKTKTDEQKRKDALAGKDPTEMGILDEEADEDALEGAGDDGNKKRGRGGDEESGGDAEDGEHASGSDAGDEGTERERGNASSGDEKHADKQRGHASGDDGSADGAGHYRVASVGEQAFAALTKIVRDVSVENRATTYSWDVTFLRPGVYGAGQKAQELVHLVVDKATAFDPVWQKAQANLAALVKRTDPDARVPALDDIIQAIRQARARDGDDTAGTLKKVVRPIGRA